MLIMITKLKPISPARNNQYCAVAQLAGKSPYSDNIWTLPELKKAADIMNKKLKKASIFGELGENDGEILKLNIEKISHKIISVEVHDTGEVEVVIETMATPRGIILKKLLDAGADFYLSRRHYGLVSEYNIVINLEFGTWDVDVMQNLRSFETISDDIKILHTGNNSIKSNEENGHNIFYIDVGNLPPGKAIDILNTIQTEIDNRYRRTI
jgi:hypothetical protein